MTSLSIFMKHIAQLLRIDRWQEWMHRDLQAFKLGLTLPELDVEPILSDEDVTAYLLACGCSQVEVDAQVARVMKVVNDAKEKWRKEQLTHN